MKKSFLHLFCTHFERFIPELKCYHQIKDIKRNGIFYSRMINYSLKMKDERISL